jgi:DNA-binding transcriptional ArsR family regulator
MPATPATPDVARIASLIGDRARVTILTQLLAGQALTATELGRAAGIAKPTASTHLAKLLAGGLLAVEIQGRHRYFRLAHPDVSAVLERLMGVAMRVGGGTNKTPTVGPADPALRKARVCYDHLAGELGVLVLDGLKERGGVEIRGSALALTPAGERLFQRLEIDLDTLKSKRRPLCLPCLDWSVRRHHLAGSLGAALLHRCVALKWAYRQRGTRVMHFSATGERELRKRLAPV